MRVLLELCKLYTDPLLPVTYMYLLPACQNFLCCIDQLHVALLLHTYVCRDKVVDCSNLVCKS